MSITKRYAALFFYVAIYQLLFFVPLFSAPGGSSDNSSSNLLSSLLLGVSPHAFHYQSLGLIPFVFGSLAISIIGMVYSPWRDLDKQGKYGHDTKKSISGKLTYLSGFVLSIVVANKTGYTAASYSFWIVVVELMFALQSVKVIFVQVQALKVSSSGLSVFFGLNIISVFIRDIMAVLSIDFTVETFTFLFGVIYFIVLTVYVTYKFCNGSLQVPLSMVKATQGVSVRLPMASQFSQAGIMPLIVSMMATGLYVNIVFPDNVGGNPVFAHITSVILFAVVLAITSFYFTQQKVSPSALTAKLLMHNVGLENAHPMSAGKALCKSIIIMRNKLVYCQFAFIILMIIFQHLWVGWSGAMNFPPISMVAGVSWFLLLNVFSDMSRHYDKLRLHY